MPVPIWVAVVKIGCDLLVAGGCWAIALVLWLIYRYARSQDS